MGRMGKREIQIPAIDRAFFFVSACVFFAFGEVSCMRRFRFCRSWVKHKAEVRAMQKSDKQRNRGDKGKENMEERRKERKIDSGYRFRAFFFISAIVFCFWGSFPRGGFVFRRKSRGGKKRKVGERANRKFEKQREETEENRKDGRKRGRVLLSFSRLPFCPVHRFFFLFRGIFPFAAVSFKRRKAKARTKRKLRNREREGPKE